MNLFMSVQPSVMEASTALPEATSGPVDMAQQIAEQGILVVIAGIFLWQNIRMNRQNEGHNKQMDELYKQILESRGEMLKEYQEISTQSLKNCLNERFKEEEVHTMEEENIANELIQQRMSIMGTTQKNSNATRIAYFSYHNGGKEFIGIPYQRMSCINSVVRPGVVSVQQKFMNMHRATFYSIFLGLQTADNLIIPVDAELQQKDPPLYEACRQDDMKIQYIHSVKNLNGMDIGFVVLVYNITPTEDAEEIVDTMAHRIEGVTQVAEAKRNSLIKLY